MNARRKISSYRALLAAKEDELRAARLEFNKLLAEVSRLDVLAHARLQRLRKWERDAEQEAHRRMTEQPWWRRALAAFRW